MKILWASHFLLFPETGFGALERSRNLLREVSKRHDLYLVSYYREKDLPESSLVAEAREDLERYCQRVILLPHPVDLVRWGRARLGIKSLLLNLPYSVVLYRHKCYQQTILDVVNQFNIDLIHVDTLGLVDDVLCQLDVAKVLNHHNVESDMMKRRAQQQKNLLARLYFYFEAHQLKAYEKKQIRLFDLNLVVSELDKKRLEANNSEARTEVVENGVDCSYFEFCYRGKNKQELIFVGSLDWYPNRDAMVFFCEKVWPKLRGKHKHIQITIVGKNPPGSLQKFASLEENIMLSGFVPDIRPLVSDAKVFICPILDGGGTRLKILDAMAQGIPVVSTAIGSEGLAVKDGIHLLLADTPDEFCAQISRLLGDEQLCRSLSRNARELVESKYSYQGIGSKLCECYEALAPPAIVPQQ